MMSPEAYDFLQLVRKCKALHIDARLHWTLLQAVLAQTKGMDFHLDRELDKIRPALEQTIGAEYLELEQAIVDETDFRPALKRLLGR